MKRAARLSLFLCALGCSAARAQNPTAGDLASLEETAKKRHAEWESLATSLEERLARILPCDPRSTTAIAEVGRMSEMRLAALSDYLRAASAKAFAETAAAKLLLDAEEKHAGEAARERADAGQEQTAVDIQSDALAQSIRQRSSLQDAQKSLGEIAALIRQRAAETEQQAGMADKMVPLLRDLVAKFDARDAALRDETAAFELERTRWNGYYSARQSRAQTECFITQTGGAPQAPARPKGKR